MNHPQQDKHRVNLILGDCLKKMKEMPDNSVDSIVTDPPYGLSFMGKKWDYDVPSKEIWQEALRVLKPGGHLLAFAGTRTQHRMAVNIEDAGFEIRDMIAWVYGCLSFDTEVLTKEGFKHFHKITQDDRIRVYDTQNDIYKWEKPQRWSQYSVEQDTAYRIKSDKTDQIVSRNHNCLVEREGKLVFVKAEDLLQMERMPVLSGDISILQEIRTRTTYNTTLATVEKIEYSGIIFCPTVSTGAFVARRNGQVFITGNSGFPKSLNIGKSVNQLETNEWSKIGKALDNIDQKSIMEVWKSNSNNVKIVETQSLKNQIIVGQDTPSENFVVLNVVQNSGQENSNLLVSFVEQNLNEVQAINTKTNTALPSVEVEIRQLQDNVNFAEKQLQNQNHKSWNIFTAQCDVKEWLSENTDVNHKVDEALKTLRGNKKYSNEEITNVLCVVLTNALKLTILNQSKTFQNLDMNQKMECVSAINVIITEYTAENLISNTVAILKSKAVDKLQGNKRIVVRVRTDGNKGGGANTYDDDNYVWDKPFEETKGTSKWEGWGTALKPAIEPITVARKPLAEKTVTENVLKFGTGGINIDGCRVGTEEDMTKRYKSSFQEGNSQFVSETATGSGKRMEIQAPDGASLGRFPANLIHDGSDEVVGLFPNSGKGKGGKPYNYAGKEYNNKDTSMFNGDKPQAPSNFNDSGSAARFFYCAKASKSERNKGLDSYLTVKYNTNICKEENIVAAQLLKKVISDTGLMSFSTGESGEHIMVQCRKDFLFTILTEINKIIELKILNLLMHSLTNESTLVANLEMENGGNLAEIVENLRKWILTITNGKTELALGASRVALETLSLISEKENWKEATNFHSTVKPVALMEYLIKMVTPKGGIVLDPFMGSGSTGVAAKKNGYDFIGIEKEEDYVKIAKARIENTPERLL